MATRWNRILKTLNSALNPAAGHRLPWAVRFVVALTLLSLVAAVLETEASIAEPFALSFRVLDLVLAVAFTAEYIARVVSAGADAQYTGLRERLRFCIRPMQVIDLLALLPFYLTVGTADAFVLRIVRLARIVTLAKLGRYSQALRNIGYALRRRLPELFLGVGLVLITMTATATVMYVLERSSNPESFGSIPRAMWWGVATVTKVGYGGAFPATVLGQVAAAILALCSIAVVAVPTGILAGAFSEAFRRDKSLERDGPQVD